MNKSEHIIELVLLNEHVEQLLILPLVTLSQRLAKGGRSEDSQRTKETAITLPETKERPADRQGWAPPFDLYC